MLHFYSIDCVKAGFLRKKKGVWYITPEGSDAIKLERLDFFWTIKQAYVDWKEEQDKSVDSSKSDTTDEVPEDVNFTIDQVEQQAKEGIRDHVAKLGPYEFQDLVAALMRGMGCYTPFVAPKGKDGGVDIIAYRDPFGTETPRIKVQVKHRQQSAIVQEVRQLLGILQRDGDVGVFVSTGGYTPDAKTTATNSQVHVRLIDLDGLIDLWHEFYRKMSDEDKALLPLYPVYFLAPGE